MKEQNKDSKSNEVDKEILETNESVENQKEGNEETPQENNDVNPLESQLKELNDKYIRLYSDFDNFRKRTNREKLDIISSANEDLLLDLIPTLDDFERAIESNTSIDDLQTLKEGFILIFNKLRNTLEAKGLKQMQAKGTPFDSELHEAIANVPAPEKSLVGSVVDDVTKGYYLNDKVIRHAKVVVGQ